MKLIFAALLLAFSMADVHAQESTPLRLVQTIALPNVEGRIDHLAVDLKGKRLFVAALGNNTVEVVDLQAAKHTQSIRGFREPQGITFISELNKLFVANGESGACDIFDGSSLKRIKDIKFPGDADNLRYDAAARHVYVGYGNGALGIIDAGTGERVGDIPLKGHPESFQLEKNGRRIFVNIPTAQQITVIDRDKRAVIATWPTGDARANYPMALDETQHRLFVAFRQPAKLAVFDTGSGKIAANLEIVGDADDVFYDSSRQRIYVAGGEGFVSVFAQASPSNYTAMAKITTAAGARTALFVTELNRLYLAVPKRGTQKAEVRIYQAQP